MIVSFHSQTLTGGSNWAGGRYTDSGIEPIVFTPASADNLILILFGLGARNNEKSNGLSAMIRIGDQDQTIYEVTDTYVENESGSINTPTLRVSGSFMTRLPTEPQTIKIRFKSQNPLDGSVKCTQAYLQVTEFSYSG
jgi:hypothetical protein